MHLCILSSSYAPGRPLRLARPVPGPRAHDAAPSFGGFQSTAPAARTTAAGLRPGPQPQGSEPSRCPDVMAAIGAGQGRSRAQPASAAAGWQEADGPRQSFGGEAACEDGGRSGRTSKGRADREAPRTVFTRDTSKVQALPRLLGSLALPASPRLLRPGPCRRLLCAQRRHPFTAV